jgi:hypothetical protein
MDLSFFLVLFLGFFHGEIFAFFKFAEFSREASYLSMCRGERF